MKRSLTVSLSLTVAALVFGLTACANATAPTPTPTPTEAIAGTNWGNAPEAVQPKGEPSISFSDDGHFTSFDGCNAYDGPWVLANGEVFFEEGMTPTTYENCEGMDTWLPNAKTAVVIDDALVMNNESGNEIGKLERFDG